jgi:hypothetical protein
VKDVSTHFCGICFQKKSELTRQEENCAPKARSGRQVSTEKRGIFYTEKSLLSTTLCWKMAGYIYRQSSIPRKAGTQCSKSTLSTISDVNVSITQSFHSLLTSLYLHGITELLVDIASSYRCIVSLTSN